MSKKVRDRDPKFNFLQRLPGPGQILIDRYLRHCRRTRLNWTSFTTCETRRRYVEQALACHENNTPGFSAVKIQDKLGVRASETAELIFDNVRVPKENVIGNVGEGFKQAMKVLDGGRISIASLSCGIARGALEASIKYANEREQFGKSISKFQGISFKLADMATEVEAAELLTFQAAFRKNNKLSVTKEGAFAKYFASEVSVKCGNEAVQIMGGYGYTKEYPAEKFLRDAKLMTIGEGTSEIQKVVISRELLNK